MSDNIWVIPKTAWSILQKLKYLLVNVDKSIANLKAGLKLMTGKTTIISLVSEVNREMCKTANAEKAVITGMINRDMKQVNTSPSFDFYFYSNMLEKITFYANFYSNYFFNFGILLQYLPLQNT